MSLKRTDKSDTSSEFYANIDRLIMLINTTLRKQQAKNAERYLKYLFEVILKYFQRTSPTRPGSPRSFEGMKIIPIAEESSLEADPPSSFPNKSILSNQSDPILDKIDGLFSEWIGRKQFNLFHFMLGLHKDCIRILLKKEDTFEGASKMVGLFKYIANNVFDKGGTSSTYESNWYQDETYNWFVELYFDSGVSMQAIALFEREILVILEYYIDHDYTDLYRKFLLRLSSSTMGLSLFDNAYLGTVVDLKGKPLTDFVNLINNIKSQNRELKSIQKFRKSLPGSIDPIMDFLKNKQIDSSKLLEIRGKLEQLILEDFKRKYIKIILVKSIIYALLKKKMNFLQIYRDYQKPKDAGVIWANEYLGLKSVDEWFGLIKSSDDIIHDLFFMEFLNNGLTIYLYNFVLMGLLSDLNAPQITGYINRQTDFNELLIINVFLDKLKDTRIIAEIFPFLPKMFPRAINETIDEYAMAAKSKREQIRVQETEAAEIDLEIVDDFRKSFMERFRETAVIRGVLEHYNLIKPAVQTEHVLYPLGVEDLMYKEPFINQHNTHYMNFSGAYAGYVATQEDFRLLNVMEQQVKCRKMAMSSSALQTFAKENTGNFDIIFSKNRYDIKTDFEDVQFREAWMEESIFRQIPGYLGLLQNHYRVFLLRDLPGEGYVFLHSQKWGTLLQYPPPKSEKSEIADFISFSFIDLDKDKATAESMEKERGLTKDQLRGKVWGQIFENIDFILTENYESVSISL